jgi:hypothetical protein
MCSPDPAAGNGQQQETGMVSADVTVDQMVEDPERHFGSPAEVVEDSRLSFADKERILESWELDARRLAESEAENMGGGEANRLDEVIAARGELTSRAARG